MTVAASTLIANTATPTDPGQLWALAYLFSADWSNGMKIHQSFMTDVTKSQSDVEQRRALILAPARMIEVDMLIRGAESIGYFRAFFMRAAMARFLFPLYPDAIPAVSGGVNYVSFATNAYVDHRFFVGQRIAIVKFDGQRNNVVSITVDVISSITSTQFNTTNTHAGVDATYQIYPLIEAELLLEQTNTVINDGLLTVSLTINESRGDFSLDALQAIGTNPGGVSFNSYPVLNLEPDFGLENNMGMQRSGEYSNNGRGKIVQVFGPRGRFTHQLYFNQFTRTKAMKVVRWFEACGGRLKAFYLLSPCTDFKAVSFTSTTVTVKSSLLSLDLTTFFGAIGVLMTDGTYQIRLVTGTTQSGANWILTVAPWSVTPSLTTIQRLSVATLVRFDTDELIEEWQTDGVMSASLPMVELTSEKDITTTNIKDFTQGYM